MSEAKLTAIQQYLAEKFPGQEIEQKHDFDREAQSFKVHVTGATLLLKVTDEFTADNDIPQILHLFNRWAMADVLSKDKKLGVLVSGRGLESFRRS